MHALARPEIMIHGMHVRTVRSTRYNNTVIEAYMYAPRTIYTDWDGSESFAIGTRTYAWYVELYLYVYGTYSY